MSDPTHRPPAKQALGADLVIPGLGVALTAYFFSTVHDLPWEAKANAVSIGSILLLLAAIFVIRVALKVRRGEATLGLDKLVGEWPTERRRLGMIGMTIAFIALMPWLGLTLSLFFGMVGAMLVMGVRDLRPLLGTAVGVAISCYLLFIALLDTSFPRGPFENLITTVLGG